MIKSGDLFLLKYWADKVEKRERELIRIVRDSVIFINPDQHPEYGMIPNLNSKN